MKNRVYFIVFVFFIVWSIILSRVYYLSVKQNEQYINEALDNTLKTELLAPVRGIIKDRNSKPLAVNKLGFSISIKPHLSKKNSIHILKEELEFITKYLDDQNYSELLKVYEKENSSYNHDFIKVVDFIAYDKMLPLFSIFNIRKNIKVEPAFKRYYPMETLASHIIGYVGKANEKNMQDDDIAKLTGYYGKDGLERSYNKILQGEPGFRKIKVNAYNREISTIGVKAAISKDITLSVDIELQKYIMEIFKDGENGKNHAGVVIVMNAKNGEILSAVSNPEYDLNKFVSGMSHIEWEELASNLEHTFTNKIINGKYPPGSVIKMGVGLSFLNSKIFNEKKSFFCTGEIEVGIRKFRCWSRWGHGRVDLLKAIRESCDVYFYDGSLVVGIDSIAQDLIKYGFGKKTDVDLSYESSGIVPSKNWKKEKLKKGIWYKGETVVTSIGQGYFLVTPLQIASYTALLASGARVTPHFVSQIDNNDKVYPTQDILTNFEKSKLPIIREGMYQVCNHTRGTAFRYLSNMKIKIAGKTGTAQVIGISQHEKKRMNEEDMKYFHRSHAWLTTYGPYENPQYVVTVLVEHGGHGGSTTGDIIKKIYHKLIDMGYIKL